MPTPLCDVLRSYAAGDPARFHMPGHKGRFLPLPELAPLADFLAARPPVLEDLNDKQTVHRRCLELEMRGQKAEFFEILQMGD